MNSMMPLFSVAGRYLALLGIVLSFAMIASAADITKSITGTIEKVDADAKVIFVKTKDGTVKAYKWAKSSTTHGIRSAEIWSKKAVHKGSHVTIRAVEVAGEDTIKGIHWFGHGALRVADATIHYVKKNGKTIAVTIGTDGKKVYEVSRHAVVDTGTELAHGFKAIGKKVNTETQGVVHLIEKNGKAFVHHIEHRKE